MDSPFFIEYNMINKIKNLPLLKIAKLTSIILIIWLVVLGVEVSQYSEQSSSKKTDAAVVLGAAVYRSRPSPVFRERINHAIELYRSGQVEAIIFTGGVGSRDEISEGEAGRQYALSAGIPDEAIFIETTSRNTYQNLANAQEIITAQGFEHVLVVSDPLHMRRAMTYAEDIGMDAEPSPTTTSRYRSFEFRMRFLFREVYFLALYRFFPGLV